MASLNTTPGSSTVKQRKTMVIIGRRRGLGLDAIRESAGGPLRGLSARQASDWIENASGNGLPNPPGEKPRRRHRPAPGVTRMITADICEQIERLLNEVFAEDQPPRGAVWLFFNFDVRTARELATAKRGGEVVRVLKEMLQRKGTQ